MKEIERLKEIERGKEDLGGKMPEEAGNCLT
jgi:hypothetical protein